MIIIMTIMVAMEVVMVAIEDTEVMEIMDVNLIMPHSTNTDMDMHQDFNVF